MGWLRLQIRAVPHDGASRDDDAEGERLAEWVRQAVAAGAAPPAAVVLRATRSDIVALGPAREAGIAPARFVAALTRSSVEDAGPPLAVAVIGVVESRRRRGTEVAAVPLATVFLEWPDNRWWYWRGLLSDDRRTVRADSEVVTRAVDGDPIPDVFGRWWALARRADLGLHLSRVMPDESNGATKNVH